MLLRRARTGGAPPAGDVQQLPLVTGSPSTGSLDALRRRVHAIGVQDVFVAAFGIGGTTSLFDFEAFAHGLAGLPDIELQAIEQAVWELEQF